jgi:hypothetical protein
MLAVASATAANRVSEAICFKSKKAAKSISVAPGFAEELLTDASAGLLLFKHQE